jgi:hypothetical protein
MSDREEGWAFPGQARKAHWMLADGRSLCGGWGFYRGSVEQGNDDSPDNCQACKKRLAAFTPQGDTLVGESGSGNARRSEVITGSSDSPSSVTPGDTECDHENGWVETSAGTPVCVRCNKENPRLGGATDE